MSVRPLKTYKNYINNSFVRSESNLVKSLGRFSSPDSTRKDLRNSIVSNLGGSPVGELNKTQIIFRLLENITERRSDLFGDEFDPVAVGSELVELASFAERYLLSLSNNYTYNNFNITSKVTSRGVRVYAFDALNYLDLFREITLSLIAGNPLTIISPHEYAPKLSPLAEVLQNSDFPTGSINILFGNVENLIKEAAKHESITALALYSFNNLTVKEYIIEKGSATLKRIYFERPLGIEDLFTEMIEYKTIWLPLSTDSF